MGAIEKLQRFEAQLDLCLEETIYDPTKFSISTGDDAVLDDIFSYQVYNKIKNHWAAATAPADIQGGMIWHDTDDDRFYGYDGAASNEIAQIWGGKTGKLFINDDACGDLTTGICINQGDADNAALVLKSSNITHGITTDMETDTYGTLGKAAAAAGGVQLSGWSETTLGVYIKAVVTTENSTKDATATGPVVIECYKKNGTTVTGTFTADSNLFCVKEGGNTRVFFDELGDIYFDGAVQAAYDEYDDPVACRDLIKHLSGIKDGKEAFRDFLKYNKNDLVKMGVISEGNFVSTKGMTSLILGAITQLNEKNQALEEKIKFLGAGNSSPMSSPIRIG